MNSSNNNKVNIYIQCVRIKSGPQIKC